MRWRRNSFGCPWVAVRPIAEIALVINEGGRGFTLTVFRKPLGLRIYLAGWTSMRWRRRVPPRT